VRKQEFKNWLIMCGKGGAALNYPKAIDLISQHYTRETGTQTDIYAITDQQKISEIVHDYSQSGRFSNFGYEHHGRFRAAIIQYSNFLSGVVIPPPPSPRKSKVFIVHGRDELAKTQVARFIENQGLSAIILHEQTSFGKTIIEKIEAYSDVDFAIVLYTPCDVGGIAGEKDSKPRARQNVVFEHGYLIGKLGRQNVCALVKGDIEIPNDISGLVYVPLDDFGAWRLTLAKEMRSLGYAIDINNI
jgi:hypothetical protein